MQITTKTTANREQLVRSVLVNETVYNYASPTLFLRLAVALVVTCIVRSYPDTLLHASLYLLHIPDVIASATVMCKYSWARREPQNTLLQVGCGPSLQLLYFRQKQSFRKQFIVIQPPIISARNSPETHRSSCRTSHRPINHAGTGGFSTRKVNRRPGHPAGTWHRG